MARASKYCIFCGDSPTTREHIWAAWLGQYIAKTKVNYTSGMVIVNLDRTRQNSTKLWGGDPHGRRLQIVCRPCNNQWMSALQTAAKPILIPLITGKSLVLTYERQKALAAWAAMSVICAEYFYPERAATSVVDRRWFFKNRVPSDSMRIWIGDFNRQKWKAIWAHSSLRISQQEGKHPWTFHPDGTPRPNTQTTTFVVGRLFIHTYSCPFPEILNADPAVRAVDQRLSQIWPPRHSFLAWPPADTLNDREADRLTGAIFQKLDVPGAAFGT
jgi:hypothetical protein